MNGYISTDVLLTEVNARHERQLAEAQQERLARATRRPRHAGNGQATGPSGAGSVLRHRAA